MTRIVLLGGGTGLPVLLEGLTDASSTARTRPALDAIVSVADSGGSSGRLRDALGIPAVGDLRNCLVALAPRRTALTEACQYRFATGELGGHALGNLVLAALCQVTGGLAAAVREAAEVLGAQGRVLPVTESRVELSARFTDGSSVEGEARITSAGRRIEDVWLEPAGARPTPGVLEAIERADAIVFSAGSLYTSVVANLLVPGVAEAIRVSSARTIYVCNLMTQPGETDGFTAADHVRVLERYLAGRRVDACICNGQPVGGRLAKTYLQIGATPVRFDAEELARAGTTLVCAELLSEWRGKVRHHPERVARVLLDLACRGARKRAVVVGPIGPRSRAAYGRRTALGE